MTVSELKDRAKELGIKGADGMKKAELEAAIAAAEATAGQEIPGVEGETAGDPGPGVSLGGFMPPKGNETSLADATSNPSGSPDGSKHVPPKLYRIS